MWHETFDRWQVTHDMWQVIHDKWHVPGDIWQMTLGVGSTLSQNFSSLSLTVWEVWCYYEDIEQKDDQLTDLINGGGVCRTAPATPGLLIKLICVYQIIQKIITFNFLIIRRYHDVLSLESPL